MKFDDQIKYMISGYFGISTIMDYQSRLYVLKDVENFIREYLKTNKYDDVDYYKLAEDIKENTSLREKLQDSLILLNQIDGPIELVIMIKTKIKELKYS